MYVQSRAIAVAKPSSSKVGQPASSTSKAWAYVGSANLSESAWGKLVLDRPSKTPKLNLRNWECGVIISVQPIHRAHSKLQRARDLKVFESNIPIPMEYPGEALGVGGRRPWFLSYED